MNHVRKVAWGTAALLLLVPAVAMQLTPEVSWDAFDFAAAAVLLGSAGLVLELTLRRARSTASRAAVVVAVAAVFALVWIQLAAGIVDDDSHAQRRGSACSTSRAA